MTAMDYVPLPEAARRLGLSSMAVRKRCQRGTLPAQKRGAMWYVALDKTGLRDGPARPAIDETTARPSRDTGEATQDSGYQEALVLAREQLAVKDRQIEAMQRQASELHTLLAQTQARVLPAAVDTSASASAVPASQERPEPRRRWWQWRHE